MGAITGGICCQPSQCLLGSAEGYAGLSTSSWAEEMKACAWRKRAVPHVRHNDWRAVPKPWRPAARYTLRRKPPP
jgi:hypothetical protein